MPKLQINGQTIGEISEETAAKLRRGIAGRQEQDFWQEKRVEGFQSQVSLDMRQPPPRDTIEDLVELQLVRMTSLDDPNP